MKSFFELPGTKEKASWIALAVLLVLCAAHIWATWARISLASGDAARWLHEVERQAQGEVAYRDFFWLYPPAALWLLAGVARLFGSSTAVIYTATSLLFALIFVAYWRYASALVPRAVLVPATLAAFLLATGYANLASAPLPMGMYTPAAPLGFLFLLAATLYFFRSLQSGRAGDAALFGLFCALCVLTKQEFGLPALFLLGMASLVLLSKREARGYVSLFAQWAGCGGALLLGLGYLTRHMGWKAIYAITGYPRAVAELGARSIPTWEGITAGAAALAVVCLLFYFALLAGGAIQLSSTWRRLAVLVTFAALVCGLHLFMSYQAGLALRGHQLDPFPTGTQGYLASHAAGSSELLLRSGMWLKQRIQRQLFPIFLPLAVAGVVFAGRKRLANPTFANTALLLLGLCFTAHLRRLFDQAEWFNFLLEIPVYIFVATLFFPAIGEKPLRRLGPGLALLLLLGAHAYWYWGVGPLTRTGNLVPVSTARGTVRLNPEAAAAFRRLAQILEREDPAGKRPVFAYPGPAGYCFFLNRKNPSPLTVGFRQTEFDPQQVIAGIRRHEPPVFLIERNLNRNLGTSPGLQLRVWEPRPITSLLSRIDLPYFEQVRAGCRLVESIPFAGRAPLTLYDCNTLRRE